MSFVVERVVAALRRDNPYPEDVVWVATIFYDGRSFLDRLLFRAPRTYSRVAWSEKDGAIWKWRDSPGGPVLEMQIHLEEVVEYMKRKQIERFPEKIEEDRDAPPSRGAYR